MKPTGPKGTGEVGPPGDAEPADDASKDASPEPPRGLSPAQAIAMSRAVVLGDEDGDVPIDLTEEPGEPSTVPLGEHEDRTDELPGQLLEAAAAAVALDPPRPRPSFGSPVAAPRRHSEPPPHAAYRAALSTLVIPVPPPFVPFPVGVAPPFPVPPAAHRPAVQPPPLALPTAPPALTPPAPAASAPLVLPSAPPALAPPAPAASAPLVLPSAPPAPTPPAPSPRPSMPSPPSSPPGGLPKVIISVEAYRPSQPPPQPAPEPIPSPAPSQPPRHVLPPRPVPKAAEASPATQPEEPPVDLADDAVLEEPTPAPDEEPTLAPDVVDIPAADVEDLADDALVPVTGEAEERDRAAAAAVGGDDGAPSVPDEAPPESDTVPPEPDVVLPESDAAPPEPDVVLPESDAAPPEPDLVLPESDATPPEPDLAAVEAAGAGDAPADEEVTPADGRTFAAEGPEGPAEEAAIATDTAEATDDIAVEVDEPVAGEAEEVSLSDVQVVRDTMEPPAHEGAVLAAARLAEPSAVPSATEQGGTNVGLGEYAPVEGRAPSTGLGDVFAPPTTSAPPPPKKRRTVEEPGGLGLDAPPSVISIPEDDVPRVAAAAVPAGLEALLAEFEPPSAPPAVEEKAAEAADEPAEELGEADVESLETEESEPSAAPLIAPERPRPSTAPRPARPRRRRRHGERRPWWEEIFDDEHIRSLPHYTADQTRREVEFIERSLGVARGARVLDLGCGDGRHAVELALHGFEVVGLDLSLPMLARAGDHAQARAVKLNFIQGDMRDLRFESAFDALYCIGTTFGYFDDDTNVQVLANAARALKPGGRFLLQVCNRDHVLWNQPRSTWFQGDDRQYLEDTDFNFITSRVTVKRSWATSAGEQETVEYSIRLYSLHEMGKLFHTAGFRVIEISGRFATPGVFFGGDSPNLVLLAEKP